MTNFRYGRPYFEVVRDPSLKSGATEDWAQTMIREDRSPTVQVAVFKDGGLALSVAAGNQPPHGPPDRRSLYCILSSTKLFTSTVMLTLHDRGYFEFDEPIANQWPEFGALGKERITYRHLLSHQAGLRLGPQGTTWHWWGDQETIGRMMASMPLQWEPGSQAIYHNRTFGFIFDHVVWRWLGKGVGDVLRDDVLGPLHIPDFHYGVSRELYETRVIKAVVGEAPTAGGPAAAGGAPAGAGDQGQGDGPEFRPRIGGEANMFNSFELLSLPLAWGTACTSAEAAAEVANFWAGGGLYRTLRLFSKETFEEACRPQGESIPQRTGTGAQANFGLGVHLQRFPQIKAAGRNLGHGGGMTTDVWVDIDHGISAACFVSGVKPGGQRYRQDFAEAVYQDFAG